MSHNLIILLAISFQALVPRCTAGDKANPSWKYGAGSPDTWYKKFKTCGGLNQSPIAFWDDEVEINPFLPMLEFLGYDNHLENLEMVNNGHTLVVSIPNDENTPLVYGGAFPKDTKYRLIQFHFHWGAVHNQGSEHTFGNDHFPFEMHLVHIKEGLTLPEALKDKTGLAVLGIFFELSNEEDYARTALTPILEILNQTHFKGDKAKLKPVTMASLLPHDTSNFFTYNGSLTTPPCSEVVVWNIFSEVHPITSDQLNVFRNIKFIGANEFDTEQADIGNFMLFNHRQPQPTYGRKIMARRHKVGLPSKCFIHENSGSSTAVFYSVLCLVSLVVFFRG